MDEGDRDCGGCSLFLLFDQQRSMTVLVKQYS
jgi:hypothetical protein